MRSELAVPLKTKERVIGVLHAQSTHLNAFDESDLTVLHTLAHLAAIFEEEAEKLGDERAALDRARRRFGDPRELTGELQETVPR